MSEDYDYGAEFITMTFDEYIEMLSEMIGKDDEV